MDRVSGLIYDLDFATYVGSMNTNAFMDQKKSRKPTIRLEETMAQSTVQNYTSNVGDDEGNDDGKNSKETRLSKLDKEYKGKTPAAQSSDVESAGNKTGVNSAPQGLQPRGPSVRSPPGLHVVGAHE